MALQKKEETKTLEVKEQMKKPPGTEDLCCGETQKKTEKKKKRFTDVLKVFVSVTVLTFLSLKMKCVKNFINYDCCQTGFLNIPIIVSCGGVAVRDGCGYIR